MPTAYPIEVTNVWKRYHLGSKENSLRDTIPALVGRLFGRHTKADQLQDVGKFWALQDVSFHVNKAETLGIIGHNGAGKSTLLKLLSRIIKQTRGQYAVRGRLAALIEVGAGFHPDLSGRENVYLNGTIMGLRRKEIDRMFDSIVEFSELEKFLDMPVKRYSSGMSVRLGFAVAAHVNPEILLIDEVLAVGDLAFQQKCYQRILDLKRRGTTIMFISHNMEAVSRICDRVVLLHEGRVIADAEPTVAITQYREEAFRRSRGRFQKVWTPLGEQVADTAHDIALTGAQLLGEDDAPRDTFEAGEAFKVRLNFRAARPIIKPSVSVTIERIDGLVCHEASTAASGTTWPTWTGAQELTLEYSAPNLLANTYLINVALFEDRNPAPLAQLTEPLYFHITTTQATKGLVDLAHEWHLGESSPIIETNGNI